jgi:hypothetical protein
MTSRKCNCPAWLSVFYHIANDSLCFEWHWQQNHDIYSVKDMLVTCSPKCVEKWLNNLVINGIGWRGIYRLLNRPDLFSIRLELPHQLAFLLTVGSNCIHQLYRLTLQLGDQCVDWMSQ